MPTRPAMAAVAPWQRRSRRAWRGKRSSSPPALGAAERAVGAGSTQARNRGAAAVADDPAAAAQRALDLGRAGLRARHLLAAVPGPDQLPGQPPRRHQAACWSTTTPITAAPRPASASCARSSATGCSSPRVPTGSTSAGPSPPPSRRAASTSPPATSPRSPRRRWPSSPRAAPVPSICLRVVQRLALEVAGRSFFSQGDARARGRRARRLRALRQQAGPAVLPRLPAAGGGAEPARRGAPLARARLQARARPDDRRSARRTPPQDPPRDLFDVLVTARDPETGVGFTQDAAARPDRDPDRGRARDHGARPCSGPATCSCLAPEVQELVAEEARAVDLSPGAAAQAHGAAAARPGRWCRRRCGSTRPRSRSSAWPWARTRSSAMPVPKGSLVVMAPWILHRHRKRWSHPERFDPTRFLPGAAADRPLRLPAVRHRPADLHRRPVRPDRGDAGHGPAGGAFRLELVGPRAGDAGGGGDHRPRPGAGVPPGAALADWPGPHAREARRSTGWPAGRCRSPSDRRSACPGRPATA